MREFYYGDYDYDRNLSGKTYIRGRFQENGIANLENIRVEESRRSQGLATALLSCLAIVAKQKGMHEIVGVFSPDDGAEDAAIRFYKRHGFTFFEKETRPALGAPLLYTYVSLKLEDADHLIDPEKWSI